MASDCCIPRTQMPQIDKAHLFTFRDWLMSHHGIRVRAGTIPASMVKPRQCGPYSIVTTPETLRKPVLISRDYWIVDGNNRWYTHNVKKAIMPYWQLPCDFEEAFELMFAFPHTYVSTNMLADHGVS
jgi:hypothetical protein